MDALLDATDEQMAVLADLVAALCAADATVNAMMAARDGLLALAGRLAVDIAAQGDHPDRGDMTIRTIAAEIGQALRVSDRTIERRMGQASALVDAFPGVWRAQGAGRITAAHAHVIIEAGAHLTCPADREGYTAVVLPLAERESPNRLRALAARVADRFHTRTIDDRHLQARTRRRVRVTDTDDAMADLHLHAPAVLIHGMWDRLTQMAHTIHTDTRRDTTAATTAGIPHDPDTRTIDEIRADLLTDLVLSGAPTGHDSTDGLLHDIRGSIQITIPVLTLLGDDLHTTHTEVPVTATKADTTSGTDLHVSASTEPPAPATTGLTTPYLPSAVLDGVIPIDTHTARLLAGTTTGWDRVLTHPITGTLLAVDRYRPTHRLRRHLHTRDQRCRFPTCTHPAHTSDLDHHHPASTGGPTHHHNLSTLCRRHHTLKHHSPWHVHAQHNGTLHWTSPTGHTYTDHPPHPHTTTFTTPTTHTPWTTANDIINAARPPF
ncbi:MAG: DUF222 domain-containing protein [Microbacterium sp.]|nr:DUF222 domain-containing protein [Microbacterium sp.]